MSLLHTAHKSFAQSLDCTILQCTEYMLQNPLVRSARSFQLHMVNRQWMKCCLCLDSPCRQGTPRRMTHLELDCSFLQGMEHKRYSSHWLSSV